MYIFASSEDELIIKFGTIVIIELKGLNYKNYYLTHKTHNHMNLLP